MAVMKQYRVVQSGAEEVVHFETETAAITDLNDWANKNVLCLDGSQELADAGKKALRDVIDAATAFRATATVPNTGWESCADGQLVCVNVSVPGILEADADGDFSVVQSGNEASDKAIREAVALVTRVKTMDDYIVVYATETPSVAIPVKIEVIR